ncbi:1436_t:CDS:2, partial [Acaulospora colombiana]
GYRERTLLWMRKTHAWVDDLRSCHSIRVVESCVYTYDPTKCKIRWVANAEGTHTKDATTRSNRPSCSSSSLHTSGKIASPSLTANEPSGGRKSYWISTRRSASLPIIIELVGGGWTRLQDKNGNWTTCVLVESIDSDTSPAIRALSISNCISYHNIGVDTTHLISNESTRYDKGKLFLHPNQDLFLLLHISFFFREPVLASPFHFPLGPSDSPQGYNLAQPLIMLRYHTFLWAVPFLTAGTLAKIVPKEPTENQSFRTGEAGSVLSSVFTDLMSGAQPEATVVSNVAESVSLTGPGASSFSWTCPAVESEGPVYSYMVNRSLHQSVGTNSFSTVYAA